MLSPVVASPCCPQVHRQSERKFITIRHLQQHAQTAYITTAFVPCSQVHRQSEREFITILHAVRDGSASREQLDRLWQLCRCIPRCFWDRLQAKCMQKWVVLLPQTTCR